MIPPRHVRRQRERLASLLEERNRMERIVELWPPSARMLWEVEAEIKDVLAFERSLFSYRPRWTGW